ncbi:MAG: hypothetical protein WC916_05165 [Candidatus Woesearchaeota archaeon]
MNYHQLIRIISILAFVVAIANILLFAFRIINAAMMWFVIVILALIAWPGINYLRKKAGKKNTSSNPQSPKSTKSRKFSRKR